ncbi:hypothetical protein [Nostoc sp. FACHB-888]|uniref:hypothetical protein n=1 Tax=Nostoc sp. FACHB-888 TaxID=2692842 RepID=UPI001687EC62|nr:hypothetical protein [Nostoc sp. FACHB-888]MBD2249053.1 hypothetical protein [Nostoc sp. FACHB-888]MCC5653642.1 hypothetical protein [Nostoc sp. XA013]
MKKQNFWLKGLISLAMTAATQVLTHNQTLKEVVDYLGENVPIKTQGNCEQQNIFEILIRAATQRDTIENTIKILKKYRICGAVS